MSKTYGYARVSTTDQDLSVQQTKLKEAGATFIRAEKRSGTTTDGRDRLRLILDLVEPGDTSLATKVDRLARSAKDLLNIVGELRAKGAELRVLDQPIDFSGAAGEMMFTILGAVAQFEASIRAERQAEGIARAKEKGVYKGRKRSVDEARIRELRAQGHGASAIAKALGIARASVYRVT
jgi:DNA invertase Pin-like site-specific DNA recombinase